MDGKWSYKLICLDRFLWLPVLYTIQVGTTNYYLQLMREVGREGGGKALLGWPLHSPVMFQVTCRFYR